MNKLAMHVVLCTLALAPARAATPDQPVVIELFTSQGCSSCPPANANLIALSARHDVLALSYSVTYWDRLGWKDTFAKTEFTTRQADYEAPLGESGPFTPQIIVDGRADTVGNDRHAIEALIAASHRPPAPALSLSAEDVAIAAARGLSGEVWLVRYDPQLQNVPVHAGENSGVTLPHKNVVRTLTRLGTWQGAQASFRFPPAAAGLKTAILIQSGRGGPLIAAARD